MKKNQLLQKPLLLASLFLLPSFCFTQVTEQWVARYNGPGGSFDRANSVAVDASGNVYVTGLSSAIAGTRNDDYATIKYNKEGVEQWVARYDGPANDFDKATSVAVDAAGNVYVTGWSTGTTGTRNTDYATIKYNAEGVEQWVARYSGLAKLDDNAEALAVDALGNVYVTGWSGWRPRGAINYTDYATIKYNAAGVQQWVSIYNGPASGGDHAYSLAVDASGNVYVTGDSGGGIRTGVDYATVKYNSAGIQLWVARYNGPANSEDRASSLALDVFGNVYVTGYSIGIGRAEDYATIKYNAAGVQQWVARYNGPGNDGDYALALAVDRSGNVYVTGYSDAIRGRGGDPLTNNDYATIKYDALGVEQWVRRYDGPARGQDVASALVLDASGNVYITGSSQNVDPHWDDYATIKYDAAGVIQWLVRYNGPGDEGDQARSLAVDALGNVYVTGASWGGVIGIVDDYATIKYYQAPAIAAKPGPLDSVKDMPSKFGITNYPNPVSATTRIEYELPFDGQVAIKVYDVLGREVTTLVNAGRNAGYHNTDFDASSLQNGVYYYRITVNTAKKVFIQSKKIIVLK